jgi:putative transposase
MVEQIGCKDAVYRTWQSLGNRYVESFNGKMRDELLNREIFTTLQEADFLIEQWRRGYNQVRPHSAPGYGSLSTEGILNVVMTQQVRSLLGQIKTI